ncbi:MAG: DsbC family protein [Pseudomonadota bacterium]|nr:DsbC family protein [Pseudomonadota bacterium]
MKSRILLLVSLLMLVLWNPAWAADEVTQVRNAVAKIVPGMAPDSIVKSSVPGFYEVVYGADIFYVSADGRYLLNGSVIDLKDGKNLSEVKRGQGRLKMISEIDQKSMIVYSPKQVKHRVTVFTDIDCQYCRRLHQEMAELNGMGIEVRYLLFPRAGVGSKSYDKAVTAWCSANQQQALTDLKAGKSLPNKTCDNPVDKHMALVEKLGITGTPTMVLEDGSMIPGYIPAARLLAALEGKE